MSVPYAGGYLGLGNSFTSQNRALPFVGGWKELGRTTLGSSGSNITVGSLSDKRYYMWLYSCLPTGGWARGNMRCNADGGNNYATRLNQDGGADTTQTSVTFQQVERATVINAVPSFGYGYISNLATKEKLQISHAVGQNTVGSANSPHRWDDVGKWDNVVDSISTLAMIKDGTGSYNTGSELVILGWDPADIHTDNFWEELSSVDLSGGAANNIDSGTITAKKYLWIEIFAEVTASSNGAFTFNADTGSNYAIRVSGNGAADSTFASLSNLNFQGTVDTKPVFQNAFIINNAADEKLMTGSNIDAGTVGAANAPNRKEYAGKWANTSNQITAINYKSNSATTFGTNTFMKVWGSD